MNEFKWIKLIEDDLSTHPELYTEIIFIDDCGVKYIGDACSWEEYYPEISHFESRNLTSHLTLENVEYWSYIPEVNHE